MKITFVPLTVFHLQFQTALTLTTDVHAVMYCASIFNAYILDSQYVVHLGMNLGSTDQFYKNFNMEKKMAPFVLLHI